MISESEANALLNTSLNNVFVTLLKVVPRWEDIVPAGEVIGSNYARPAITFGVATDGERINNASVTFNTATADWSNATSPFIALAIMNTAVPNTGRWQWAMQICPLVVLNTQTPPPINIGGMRVSMKFVS